MRISTQICLIESVSIISYGLLSITYVHRVFLSKNIRTLRVATQLFLLRERGDVWCLAGLAVLGTALEWRSRQTLAGSLTGLSTLSMWGNTSIIRLQVAIWLYVYISPELSAALIYYSEDK